MGSVTVDTVMAEARASAFTRRSIKGASKLAALRLALSMLDLTTLEGKDTPEKVRSLCRKGVRPGAEHPVLAPLELPSVAAVCVYPSMVAVAVEALDRLGARGRVKVASVATGFPSGQYPLRVRLDDTDAAIRDGADEIDMVINRGAFLAGRVDEVEREIREVAAVCGERAHLKVILETGELETLDNVRRASDAAIRALHDAGAPGAFIKTSTGKVQPAATMPVTLVMLEAIRDHALRTGGLIGMKPAGGIGTAKQAIHYLVMVKETLTGVTQPGECPWLTPRWFRFGASSLLNDLLRQIAWLARGRYSAMYDFAEA